MLLNRVNIYRFIRFGIVGGINTLLDLIVLNSLVYILSVTNPFVFSICKGISFFLALINSYFMNKYFTFAKKESKKNDFYKFIFFSLIGFIVNILASSFSFYLLTSYSNIFSVYVIVTLSGIIGALFSLTVNYFSYSYFIFK
jgi:putative flippase GtrA